MKGCAYNNNRYVTFFSKRLELTKLRKSARRGAAMKLVRSFVLFINVSDVDILKKMFIEYLS